MLALAAPVAAQTAFEDSIARRTVKDHDPNGLVVGPAGSFLLFPTFTIDTVHTDNLFATDSGKVSDQFVLLNPTIAVRSDWDNHALNLSAGATYARHRRTPNEDWIDYRLAADGRLDIALGGRATAAASVQREHEPRSSPDDSRARHPTRFQRFAVDLGGAYRRDAILLKLDLHGRRLDFRDNGGVNEDDRDRNTLEARGRAGYELVPGSSAFVEAAYNVRDFDQTIDDNGFKRSSDGYEVLVGTTLDLSGVTFAEAAVGYRDQRIDDPDLPNVTGVSFLGRLVWNPTDLITVTAHLRRLVNETTLVDASADFTSTVGMRIDYSPLEDLLLNLAVEYRNDAFKGIAREDDDISIDLGGRYLFGRNFFAGLSYGFEHRSSNEFGADFTENRVRLSIGAKL